MEYRRQQQQQQEEEEENGMAMGYNNPPLPPPPGPPPPPPPPPVPIRVSAFSKLPSAPAAAAALPPLPLHAVRNGTDTSAAAAAATQLHISSSSSCSHVPQIDIPISNSIISSSSSPAVVLKYKECLRNHAAALGGHVLDGCGEYMAAAEEEGETTDDSSGLKCAACGCHRSFHRRELAQAHINNSAVLLLSGSGARITYYRRPVPLPSTNHHHVMSHNSYKQQLVPPAFPPSPSAVAIGGNNNSGSGATTESSSEDRPEEQHHDGLLREGEQQQVNMVVVPKKRRFRTKFTAEQKEKMLAFAERVGWRFHKQDEAAVDHLCRELGVRRQVLKVWMHNNKHSIKKQQQQLQQPLQNVI